MMATLSPAALSKVINLPTVWSHLHNHFASSIQARLLQLKFELHYIKKGTLTMSEYLDKVKQLVDDLVAAGKPDDHDDLVFYT